MANPRIMEEFLDWSDTMANYDYREPIEIVVDKYFENKRWHYKNSNENKSVSTRAGEYPDDRLSDIPCKIIRNSEDIVYKFIYGDIALLETEEECDPVIWQEELKRDAEGAVEKIITTYPNGSILENQLIRDDTKKVIEYK